MSGKTFSRSVASMCWDRAIGHKPSYGNAPHLPETWEEALTPNPLGSAINEVDDSWMQFMMAHDDDLYLPKWW